MKATQKVWSLVGFFASTALVEPKLYAADTVEPFDVGLTNVDFYVGADGLGPRQPKSLYSDMMIGGGLTERLSFYLGATLGATELLANGNANPYLGLYGNVLNTDHIDLDLFLDFSLAELNDYSITPSFELNFDFSPDQETWGIYLRCCLPVASGNNTGQDLEQDKGQPAEDAFSYSAAIESTLGAYFTFLSGHQLLLELDATSNDLDTRPTTDLGGIALGYNVAIHDNIELINQVYVEAPPLNQQLQQLQQPEAGLMAGFIATLP